MIKSVKDMFGRGLNGRALDYWKAAADSAPTMQLGELKQMRTQARALRQHLDEVEHIASGRLAHPRLGTNAMRKPTQTDWAYRPEVWRGAVTPAGFAAAQTQTRMGSSTTLFHDCKTSEITLRQVRNTRDSDLAPFGLRLEVLNFDGSFLSVVIDLPDTAIAGLRIDHIIRIDAEVEAEQPIGIFARLNIKFGPNVEQIIRELPIGLDNVSVEFDLEHTKLNEKSLERMWLDLIIDGVAMNEITLRDVTLTRRPRAAF